MKFKLYILLIISLSALTAKCAVGDVCTIGNIDYYISSEDDHQAVLWRGSQQLSGFLDIPSSIDFNGVKYTVAYIDNHAFQSCQLLTSVYIPKSISWIGIEIFTGCSSLTDIIVDEANQNYCTVDGVLFNKTKTELRQYPGGRTGGYIIPASVTKITQGAFAQCPSLTSIVIPDSVTEIGGDTFWGCYNLSDITLPNTITSIVRGMFAYCYSLADISLPSTITTIEETAFFCSGITSLDLPRSIKSIGDSSFCQSQLANISLPNSVISIGEGAFRHSQLKEIIIPGSVKEIGTQALSFCGSLNNIIVEPDNPNFSSLDGILFNKNRDTLILYPQARGGQYSHYSIPDYVEVIADYAFASAYILSITIPKSVNLIQEGAFRACFYLSDIIVDKDNPNYSSQSGVLFNKNKTILKQCPGYKEGAYCIPSTVTEIEEWAFFGCWNLTSVTFPPSIKKIESFAFWDCRNISSFFYNTDLPIGGDETIFDGCYDTATLYIPTYSLNKFRNLNPWKNFLNIEEYDFDSSIPDIEAIPIQDDYRIFNINGFPLSSSEMNNLPSGIYIIKQRGKCIKRVIK